MESCLTPSLCAIRIFQLDLQVNTGEYNTQVKQLLWPNLQGPLILIGTVKVVHLKVS